MASSRLFWRDQSLPERFRFSETELSQAAGEPVVSVHDNTVDGSLPAGSQQVVKCRAPVLRPADPFVNVLANDRPFTVGNIAGPPQAALLERLRKYKDDHWRKGRGRKKVKKSKS